MVKVRGVDMGPWQGRVGLGTEEEVGGGDEILFRNPLKSVKKLF